VKWIEEIDNYNFLGIYDVMLDIKTEINISPDRIIIPLLQHRINFPQLFSIDSAGERDRYCDLRWKAIAFLKKKAIIKDFRLIKSSHRWDSKLEIELEKQIFEDVLDKMNVKHKKEVSREISNAQNNKVVDDIMQDNQEKSKTKENVFIIHGKIEARWRELKDILEKEFKLIPIILSEKPDLGRTIIEKFEEYAKTCSCAIAIFTPDDEVVSNGEKYLQAKPNVIYELGWFCGHIGRNKVILLLEEGTTIFSDFGGIVQKRFIKRVAEKTNEIRKDLEQMNILERK